jgi:hypothetical protein
MNTRIPLLALLLPTLALASAERGDTLISQESGYTALFSGSFAVDGDTMAILTIHEHQDWTLLTDSITASLYATGSSTPIPVS